MTTQNDAVKAILAGGAKSNEEVIAQLLSSPETEQNPANADKVESNRSRQQKAYEHISRKKADLISLSSQIGVAIGKINNMQSVRNVPRDKLDRLAGIYRELRIKVDTMLHVHDEMHKRILAGDHSTNFNLDEHLDHLLGHLHHLGLHHEGLHHESDAMQSLLTQQSIHLDHVGEEHQNLLSDVVNRLQGVTGGWHSQGTGIQHGY